MISYRPCAGGSISNASSTLATIHTCLTGHGSTFSITNRSPSSNDRMWANLQQKNMADIDQNTFYYLRHMKIFSLLWFTRKRQFPKTKLFPKSRAHHAALSVRNFTRMIVIEKSVCLILKLKKYVVISSRLCLLRISYPVSLSTYLTLSLERIETDFHQLETGSKRKKPIWFANCYIINAKCSKK